MYKSPPNYRFYKQDKPLRRIWADGYTQVECIYITTSILNILKNGDIVIYGDYDKVNPSVYNKNSMNPTIIGCPKYLLKPTDTQVTDEVYTYQGNKYVAASYSTGSSGLYLTNKDTLVYIKKYDTSELWPFCTANSGHAYNETGWNNISDTQLICKLRKLSKKELFEMELAKKTNLTICQRYWLDKYTYRNLFAGIITTCICLAIGAAGALHLITPLIATFLVLATLPIVALILLLLPKESLLEEMFSNSNQIDAELACPLTPPVEDDLLSLGTSVMDPIKG